MAPVRTYSNWNSRATDYELQREPYRKYFFICEGANTETWYFRKLIDIRKALDIHPLIDIRLLEKTEGDRDISYPKKLISFAELQKDNPAFELFLLLHFEGAYETDIIPHAKEIIRNKKEGNQTFIYKLLLGKTGINAKKTPKIGELAKRVETAILQEKKVNEDIHDCKGKITCNIGKIIENIRNDNGK